MSHAAALPVHPFPARMAPELALSRLPAKPASPEESLRILDPMMGSGTIPLLASLAGHRAVGLDVDPLAVLVARTWSRPLDEERFTRAAEEVQQWARTHKAEPLFPDEETRDFADFWFDSDAQGSLASLAAAIERQELELQDALWCALSRQIITKDVGASRARDVSHSRPHRVRDKASFDPIDRFHLASRAVAARHRSITEARPPAARLILKQGDARQLPLRGPTFDMAMTSPPYLQAIDYLRGHRMSLIWMGHSISELRTLRSESIGSEKALASAIEEFADIIDSVADGPLPKGREGVLARYVADLNEVVLEMKRVLKPEGTMVFVVAEATLAGIQIRISEIVRMLAARSGFTLTQDTTREILRGRRYLPPPTSADASLDRRMKQESCLSFQR